MKDNLRIETIAASLLFNAICKQDKEENNGVLSVETLCKDLAQGVVELLKAGEIKFNEVEKIKMVTTKLLDDFIKEEVEPKGKSVKGLLSILSRKDNLKQMVRESSKRQVYIVCANDTVVTEIMATAKELNLQIPFPIVAKELPIRSQFIESVIVFDMEAVLEEFIGKTIAITAINN